MSLYPKKSLLDEEIESWKGFPWALRQPDKELWERMIGEVKQYADAVEHSGRTFTTDAFFMAILLVEQRMIKQLKQELQEESKKVRPR